MSFTDAVPQSRAGVRADDALTEERVLHALVVDVVVEHIGDRRVEEDVDHPLVVTEQRLELVARRGVADPGVAAPGAQPLPHLVEDVLVRPVAVDVVARQPHRVEARLRLRVVEPLPRTSRRRETAPTGSGRRRTPRVRVWRRSSSSITTLIEQPDDVRARAHDVALVGERPLERARAPRGARGARARAPTCRLGRGYAAQVRPLWPPPTTTASQSRRAVRSAIGAGRPTSPRASAIVGMRAR